MKKKSPISAYSVAQLSIDPIQPIQGTKINSFETRMVGYSVDPSWHSDFVVTDLINVISLEISPYDGVPLDLDLEVSVTLSIRHFSFPSGNVTSKEHTLSVSYTKDGHAKFKKVDLLKLTGGQRVIITIKEIGLPRLPSSTSTSDVLSKVVLSAYTEDSRYYRTSVFEEVDCSTIIFINTNQPEIEMYWAPLPYAEEYDVEIVHDDVYGQEPSSTGLLKPFATTYPVQEGAFYGNSTRITTQNNFLILPLINERSQYRIRVRPVGRQGRDFEHRYEHRWSCEDYIHHTNHAHTNDELNYQTITTYAEEGKYKIVNEYFDGRMAGRQKVTRMQSNQYSLVQESIFDAIGRKAIEVLPGPVKNGELDFYPGFNQNISGQPYSFRDFEAQGNCIQPPQPMSKTTGTSFYYSDDHYNSLSPQEKESHLKLIPHAFGYPFSQTRFMNDNTNRPLAQGGVGRDHIIGSSHETEISYVFPTQSELDRLFGTEVGFAKYYKKVVTQDPNNQVSFAYQDLKGNTIATSLWGGVENLDTLASYRPNNFIDDLTAFSKWDSLNYEIFTEYTFMVSNEMAIYTFDYNMLAASFQDLTCNLTSICYDCIYDIGIFLVNTDCNDTLYQRQTTIGDVSQKDQVCQGLTWESDLRTVTLTKGNHAIRVSLSVNEDAANIYVSDYLSDPSNECIRSLRDFEEEYLAEIPDLPCHYDCDNYEEEITTLEARIERAKRILSTSVSIEQAQELQVQIGQWHAAIKAWIEMCDTDLNFCEQARLRMLSDLSPFGQYASLSIDTVTFIYSAGDLLSIFHPNNLLADNGQAFCLHPSFSFPYVLQDGTAIDLRDSLVAGTIGLSEFVNNYWQDEWAEQFLPFHPEHCYYEMCSYISADFDRDLMNVHSAAQAIQEGYILANGMGSPNLMLYDDPSDPEDVFDPQFQPGGFLPGQLTMMEDEVNNYFLNYPAHYGLPATSIYELAIASVCSSIEVDYEEYGDGPAPITNCINVLSFDYPDEDIADKLWDAYRGLYLSLKQKYEYQRRSELALLQGCYNECIGRDSVNIIRDSFILHLNNQDICHPIKYHFFKDKNKVFPGPYDVPGMDSIDNIYDYENIDAIANAIQDWVLIQALDSSNCGISGELAEFPLEGANRKEQCITYDCLNELPEFLNQFIVSTNGSTVFDLLSERDIDAPPCLGLSPFLLYRWDAGANITGTTFNGTIGVEGLDPGACQVFIHFPEDQFPDPSNIESIISSIDDIISVELDNSVLDQNGESNRFVGRAHASFGEGMNVEFVGYVSCAVFGRCCVDGVEDAISACLEIINVDDPETTEEHLWIGESNPYFDPAWIKNPCQQDSNELDTAYITCIGDTTALCCPDTIIPGIIMDSCEQERIDLAYHNAMMAYQQYIEDKAAEIKNAYMLACLDVQQDFTMEHASSEHHFVLSYYDQSGNLTRTVPPNGTYDYYDKYADPDRTFQSISELDGVTQARDNGNVNKPDYSIWDTRYTYNSLNQITSQNLPDHGVSTPPNQIPARDGVSRFFFDRLGRLNFSQNPEQALEGKFSYTEYDQIGRTVESGQVTRVGVPYLQSMAIGTFYNPAGIHITGGWKDKEQIVHTYYDEGSRDMDILKKFPKQTQSNLRNSVAYAAYYDVEADLDGLNPLSASFYSYDMIGNVHTLVQYLRDGFLKSIDYSYDPISGNVREVHYQKGSKDQFIHRYHYDSDNRITKVETSTDGIWWDKEARYFFYPHGSLARTEFGGEEVQGIDHVYTIHGWIKGINSVALLPGTDPGGDGGSNNLNQTFARDELGYMLNYYDQDYVSISGSQSFEPEYKGGVLDLFNGNIRNMTTSIGHFVRENTEYGYLSNNYAYDQLNRITEMRPWDDFNPSTNLWDTPQERDPNLWSSKPYYTSYRYDGNGNILNLLRNGALQQVRMDDFTYKYDHGNNQLTRVQDQVPSTNYPLDPLGVNSIYDHDGTFGIGHIYDRIGNMTEDLKGGLNIDWNMQGKVSMITDDNGIDNQSPSNRVISFQYDPLGNRIGKIVDDKATYYVRDAQGNVMSTYTKNLSGKVTRDGKVPVKWEEAFLYGSGRLGAYEAEKVLYEQAKPSMETNTPLDKPMNISVIDIANLGIKIPDDYITVFLPVQIMNIHPFSLNNGPGQPEFEFALDSNQHQRSRKIYELNNHLGNVLTTLSDRKSAFEFQGSLRTISSVLSSNDYYPGGMLTPGRSFLGSNTTYRFKHQGQESDNEVAGLGANYFYDYRMSDARLNRFWSVDPLFKKLFFRTPYNFAANSLVRFRELAGLQPTEAHTVDDSYAGDSPENAITLDPVYVVGESLPPSPSQDNTSVAKNYPTPLSRKVERRFTDVEPRVFYWKTDNRSSWQLRKDRQRKQAIEYQSEQMKHLSLQGPVAVQWASFPSNQAIASGILIGPSVGMLPSPSAVMSYIETNSARGVLWIMNKAELGYSYVLVSINSAPEAFDYLAGAGIPLLNDIGKEFFDFPIMEGVDVPNFSESPNWKLQGKLTYTLLKQLVQYHKKVIEQKVTPNYTPRKIMGSDLPKIDP